MPIYNEDFKRAQDYELIVSSIVNNKKVLIINDPLYILLKNEFSISSNFSIEQINSKKQILDFLLSDYNYKCFRILYSNLKLKIHSLIYLLKLQVKSKKLKVKN